jgi:hypothetical protein
MITTGVPANAAPPLSIAAAKDYVDTHLVPALMDTALTVVPEEHHYGLLAQDAMAKVRKNPSNMIAFLKDMRRPQDMIPKLRKLQELKKIQKHASNYLAINYGLLPTMSDLQNIVAAFKSRQPYIDRFGYRTYTAVRTSSTSQGNISCDIEQRIKLAIEDEDSDLARFSNSVDENGFALTLENVWDLIPYSFVLDWFIDVGGFLERCDTRMRLMRYNIRYVTMSRKKMTSAKYMPNTVFPFTGELTMVQYSRWTEDHCPEPPLFSTSNNSVSDHWLEAGALIIQRTK